MNDTILNGFDKVLAQRNAAHLIEIVAKLNELSKLMEHQTKMRLNIVTNPPHVAHSEIRQSFVHCQNLGKSTHHSASAHRRVCQSNNPCFMSRGNA